MGKILYLIFVFVVGLSLVLCEDKITRARRDLDAEMLALQVAGIAMEAFDRGAALDANYQANINGFGVKSGSKIGFGEAMKNDDNKRRRRRRSLLYFRNNKKEKFFNNKIRYRRSPCNKHKNRPTTDNPNDEASNDDQQEQNRKRRNVDPEDAEILPEFDDNNDTVSTWKKVLQICSDMIQKLHEWTSEKIREAINNVK